MSSFEARQTSLFKLSHRLLLSTLFYDRTSQGVDHFTQKEKSVRAAMACNLCASIDLEDWMGKGLTTNKVELSPRAGRGRLHFDRSKRRALGVRERVLATADNLFFNEGIHETGINKLIDQAGVAKASFYSTFASKDDLVEACLESRHKASLVRLRKIESQTASLETKIGDVFDLLVEAASKSTFRGCIFVVAAIEQHGRNLPAFRWVRIHKLAVRDTFVRMLISAGVNSAREIAEQLSIIYDGSLVTAAVRPRSGAIQRARFMAISLIRSRSSAP
ncbi:TetR/AcrR family transcriptional regulator [Nitrobacter winogradskyi]|uniref:AcrR family transcriptional regulator n=1 Tax=Nitrobacter winogradskyi TaxID=913 RepID=A0ACC6AFN6_NITWI|nr:TetR/AcrR family transcriptional regulator [Nitrobacter winogradskyi]MCP1998511.1 AcrR family transcriptional regulator [Nitrobacter winogradskyi]